MFGVFAVVTVCFLVLLSVVVTHSFSELEAEKVLQDTTRVRTAFNTYAGTLRAVASDWAHWTETYDFVAGRLPEYPAQNLSNDALANINVDFMVFLDSDGEPVQSTATDPATGAIVEFPEPTQRAIVNLNRSVAQASSTGTRSGLVVLPSGVAAVAMEPITTNEENVEPNGVLVIGRFIDAEEVAEVERVTKLSVTAGRPSARASILPRHPYGPDEELGKAYFEALDADTMESWATVQGIDGRAALLFAVREYRAAMERASETLHYVGLGLVGFSVFFGIAFGLTMESAVMRRLTKLHDEVIGTGASGANGRRLTVDGNKHAADHDFLTGLLNRRRLEEDTANALAEAERNGQTVAYILFDLDGFKSINDTRGHQCGDAVLVWFAELLRSEVRSYSTIARVGGDEFAIMMPRAGDYEAAVVADRVMTALSERPCDACDGEPFVMGASIGIAVTPRDGTSLGELSWAADDAMYASKSARARDCEEPG